MLEQNNPFLKRACGFLTLAHAVNGRKLIHLATDKQNKTQEGWVGVKVVKTTSTDLMISGNQFNMAARNI